MLYCQWFAVRKTHTREPSHLGGDRNLESDRLLVGGAGVSAHHPHNAGIIAPRPRILGKARQRCAACQDAFGDICPRTVPAKKQSFLYELLAALPRQDRRSGGKGGGST